MKSFTRLLLASAGVSFLLLSCEKESLKVDKENEFNVPFTANINEHIALKSDGSQVLITVKNISDHRCVNHLDCLDAGIAAVRVQVSTSENSKAESFLYLGTVGEDRKTVDSVTVRLDKSWYVVSLHSVNPHPIMDATEPQTAELSIKPKP